MCLIAVLSGDLINSTRLSSVELDEALLQLEHTCQTLNTWDQTEVVKFSRVSGDGWQVALTPHRLALRVALILQTTLAKQSRGMETRVSIAHGRNEGPVPEDLNAASGPAFTASGRLLRTISDPFRMRYADQPHLDALAVTLDALAQSWSPNQADVIGNMIKWPDQKQTILASQMGKSKQAVSKALKAAKADAVMTALTRVERKGPEDETFPQ